MRARKRTCATSYRSTLTSMWKFRHSRFAATTETIHSSSSLTKTNKLRFSVVDRGAGILASSCSSPKTKCCESRKALSGQLENLISAKSRGGRAALKCATEIYTQLRSSQRSSRSRLMAMLTSQLSIKAKWFVQSTIKTAPALILTSMWALKMLCKIQWSISSSAKLGLPRMRSIDVAFRKEAWKTFSLRIVGSLVRSSMDCASLRTCGSRRHHSQRKKMLTRRLRTVMIPARATCSSSRGKRYSLSQSRQSKKITK